MDEEPRHVVTGQKVNDASVGNLLGALARDTGTLVRQEVQLASAEITTKVKKAALNLGTIVTGGALAHAGLLALLAGIVIVLGSLVPVWISAMGIGVVGLVTGFVLVQRGVLALRELDPIPTQTLNTLKNDAAWAKEQLHGH